ncbi:unnamed protein product [Pedinophyceae sp. YPF-701]|nr:unnamed protein product [Pedinophyceae sp. YPF-701]
MVAWIGARVLAGEYGGLASAALTVLITFVGVVSSDMITFWLGAMLRKGAAAPWAAKWLPAADATGDKSQMQKAAGLVRRWGRAIGAVQRFSVGFRGPICLAAGLAGVSGTTFCAGVCLGALGTMAAQFALGGVLATRVDSVYVAVLALVAGPNAVGHLLAPAAAAAGAVWAAATRWTRRGGGGGGSAGQTPAVPSA